MPSDIAKVTLDYRRQYGAVVFQQGRVGLEADTNESSLLAAERLRSESAEIVGITGTPDDGYAVTAGANPYDLSIKHGTMYVGGVRVFAPNDILYSDQSEWIDHQSDPLWSPPIIPTTKYELVYLLLQEHEIGAVEDGALREVALGGPDTCARTRIVQHIVRMGTSKPTCAGAMKELRTALALYGLTPEPLSLDASGNWSGGRLVPGGSMQVTFQTSVSSANLCEPQAQGGYTQPDNQMIRVKVATYAGPNSELIWAYDDASFIYRAAVQDGKTLKLATTPVDSFHRPVTGQAVEVTRAAARLYTGSNDGTRLLSDNDYVGALDGFVTTLAQDYDPDTGLITITDTLPAEYQNTADNPPFDGTKKAMVFVRVWNQKTQFTPGTAVTLSDSHGSTGVQVKFGQDAIHEGSFWMMAVRPTTPTNIYPDRYLRDFQPAEGPRLWVCPLAVINWVATGQGVQLNTDEDCRNSFASLVDLTKRCPPPASAYATVQAIDWPNDQVIALSRFNQGFTVTLSRAMAPETITEQTFQVALDILNPPQLGSFGGPVSMSGLSRLPFTIRGEITPSVGNTVFTFVPKPALTLGELQQFLFFQSLYESFAQGTRTPGVRCRIVLAGDTILDTNGVPLDGEAFGNLQVSAVRKFTRLLMPATGDGVKGGDFRSWLFIGIPATVQMSPTGSFATGSGPSQVDLYFSKPMATASIQQGLTVTSSATATGTQPVNVTFPTDFHAVIQPADGAGTVLTRFPDPPAGQTAVTYTITLDGQTVVDQDGLQLDGNNTGQAGTNFTGDFKIVVATQVATMTPTGNVPPNAPVNLVTITFSGPIDQTSVKSGSITLVDGGGSSIAGQAQAVNATTATFTPTTALPIPGAKAAAMTYTATVFGTGPNAITDASGVPIAGIAGLGPGHDFHGQFTLLPLTGVASFDPKPPLVGGRRNVYPDGSVTTVVIIFTANVTIASAALQNALTVTYGIGLGTTTVPGTVTQISPTVLHFDPTAGSFAGNAFGSTGDRLYTIHLLGHSCVDTWGAAIDGAGNGVSGSDFTSTFAVGPPLKDPTGDKNPSEKVGTTLVIKENVPLGGLKLTQEVATPLRTATRIRTRRTPPTPPPPPAGGGPGAAAAAGQPFIRAEERPVVGGPAMLAPNP